MTALPQKLASYNGTSSTTSHNGILTPLSSSTGTASHISATNSDFSTASGTPVQRQPSYQMQQYVHQVPAHGSAALQWQVVGQPQGGNLAGRIAFYTSRAQQTITGFDQRFNQQANENSP